MYMKISTLRYPPKVSIWPVLQLWYRSWIIVVLWLDDHYWCWLPMSCIHLYNSPTLIWTGAWIVKQHFQSTNAWAFYTQTAVRKYYSRILMVMSAVQTRCFRMRLTKISIFLMTWSPYFPLRQPIWGLLLPNPSDHQRTSIFWHVGFPCPFLVHFPTCSPLWSLSYYDTSCKTEWDRHSFLDQWYVLESGGHGH